VSGPTASLLDDVLAGAPVKPATQALARWDGVIAPWAVERVHQLKLKDLEGDRSSGEGRFRGSLLGACARMQMLSYRGYLGTDPDDTGVDIMRDGTYRHYLWQEVGLSAGFLSDIEVKASYPEWEFGGQLDGLMAPVDGLPGRGGFELKTTKWDYFKEVKDTGKPLHKHLLQIGGYFKALDLDWFSVVYELRGARIEFVEFVVFPQEVKTITEANFGGLMTWRDREELPPVKDGYPNDKECAYWCGYTKICPSATY